MKVDQRGRGKYRPAPNLSTEEIKQFLNERILEEKQTEAVIDLEGEVQPRDDKFNVVSLFCGAGGLDLGFELAGLQAEIGEQQALDAFANREVYKELREQSVFHTIFANDFFKEALETYTLNNPEHIKVLNGDIRKVKKFPRANLVLGGFPCPGFSGAGPRLIDDKRNFLYLQFIRCLTQSEPEIFVAENVKGMLTLGNGEVFRQIVEDFSAVGYTVYPNLVNSRNYGVPQLRERVFLVGVKNSIKDFQYELPQPSHGIGGQAYVTLEDAIGDLKDHPGDYYKGSFSSMYMSRNRKKNWDEQSFTIQASGRQAPLHPGGEPMRFIETDHWEFTEPIEENRRLSVTEVKRIQTFPDWYVFNPQHVELKNSHIDKKYKQIGNAVPVMLARSIALPIAKWVKQRLAHKHASAAKEQQETETVQH
ncbi:DNA cytosine methyltransferase [Paenibacillus agricola]|uniref:Cytosine-specific methyltransferase n=1 Tax=Paenibacillus agricola TaxID=2716264 RepID=A0ABX0J2N3_9BACL|nr:DNA cytosine methyltransferase [Paenibacillus agricola]NHN30524.1 DNA cytosine methyltransferase [Paenibacillus agricola]